MDFTSCAILDGFCKSKHICRLCGENFIEHVYFLYIVVVYKRFNGGLILHKSKIQWALSNPTPLGPKDVQITETFAFVKRITNYLIYI